jgi:hypothetical protein
MLWEKAIIKPLLYLLTIMLHCLLAGRIAAIKSGKGQLKDHCRTGAWTHVSGTLHILQADSLLISLHGFGSDEDPAYGLISLKILLSLLGIAV